MSLPRSDYDPRRVCVNPFPFLNNVNLGKHRRTFGVYLAGGLVSPTLPLPRSVPTDPSFVLPISLQFSLGLWTFFDAAILSAHAHPPYNEPNYPVPVHVTFADWVPGLCSLLGILVINLIDKDRIRGEEGFSDSRAVWRARLFLFVGFALMAGGLAGSVVRYFFSHQELGGRVIVYIGIAGAQIRHSRVSRAVSVLRVRQRRRERVPYAFRSRALDRTKRKWRVRVQPLDLISCGCNYVVILHLNPCIRPGHQSLIPIAFGPPFTPGYSK